MDSIQRFRILFGISDILLFQLFQTTSLLHISGESHTRKPFSPQLDCNIWGKKLKSILTFSNLSLASRESLSVLRLVSPSLEPCLSVSTLLSLLGLSVSHSILSSIRFSLQSLGSLTLLDRRSSLVPPLTLASESSPIKEPSPAQALVSQLEFHSPRSKNIRLFFSGKS
ncbi:unnamed protein product, partial [Brassica napus]